MELIVQVLPHSQHGGVREVAGLLDAGLPRHGMSSRIVDLEARLGELGSSGQRFSPALPQLWHVLWRGWRRERPLAVIPHTVGAGAATLWLAWLAGVPKRVQVVHGNRATLGFAKTSLVRLMRASRVATDVVFVGHAAADSYGRLASLPHVSVIQNGVVLPERLQRRSAVRHEPTLRAVFAGRLVPGKGAKTAVLGCMSAATDVHLTVCGEGPDHDALAELASLDPRVEFVGMLERDQLREVFEGADVLLFPSINEGLPLILIEAAQAGAAVVARDTGFSREVMGDDAIYLDTDDPDAWATTLDNLNRVPHRLSELRDGSLQRATAFTPERMVADYARLLKS